MAHEGYQITKSAPAASSLASYQYCAVGLTANGELTLSTADTQGVIGILQDAPTAGQSGLFCALGISKAKVDAGTDIAVGNFLTSSSGGKLIANTTSGCFAVAIAFEVATNNPEIITVLVAPRFIP